MLLLYICVWFITSLFLLVCTVLYWKALQRNLVDIFRQPFVFRGKLYDIYFSMLWPVGSRENGTNVLKKYVPLKWFNLFFIQMLYFYNVHVKLLNIVLFIYLFIEIYIIYLSLFLGRNCQHSTVNLFSVWYNIILL